MDVDESACVFALLSMFMLFRSFKKKRLNRRRNYFNSANNIINRTQNRQGLIKSIWVHRTSGNYWEETVPHYSDYRFQKKFRLKKKHLQVSINHIPKRLQRA